MRTISMLTTTAALGLVLTVAPAEANPPAGTPAVGIGAYAAVDGGANVYQNFDDTFTRREFTLHLDHNVSGYGGIKLGYVFGTGDYRFALEEDMFYNGISTSAHVDENGREVARSSNHIRTGAFLTNGILRFAMDDKFQPYLGGGVGAYYAKTQSGDVTIGGRTFETVGGRSSGSLAYDGIAGLDYYWTPDISTFVEYHYLGYAALDVGDGNHRLGQHLVGAGVRFHFCFPG
jgi:opacity protein-like surface antigen